jgi:transposase
VLWIARTGSPWRDLSTVFGPWNSAYVRFALWAEKNVWQNIFAVWLKMPISKKSSSTALSCGLISMLAGATKNLGFQFRNRTTAWHHRPCIAALGGGDRIRQRALRQCNALLVSATAAAPIPA